MKKNISGRGMFEKREGKWVGRGNCASQVCKNRTRVILWRGGEEGVVKVVKTASLAVCGKMVIERQERRDKKSVNGLRNKDL